ncbi:2-dehydropantoate 2-reductase [Polynucleobacter acidiphobus]|uniref:2-dehydropantoate 2-reductase n=1 Tax=Polynucleobacter acidiphobus TaxID=556053 RepID=UPI000D392739|nr:2-dehydropantoate 2-reductase [Polynucleobacter acidiphobus]
MKILIVGAGGIGGFFGAKLINAGADITFLLRDKRHQLIQAHGLTIETPKGSFTVHPKAVTAGQLEPIYDLIILAPKAFDLDESLKSLTKASTQGVLLPFLNGLSHMEALDQQFGKARVMGGVAHIAAMITDKGAVKQLTDLNMLTVGPRAPDHEALTKEFIALCKMADFDSAYSENIEQVLWDKWVFLATLAGMTTLCRGSVGEIVSTPYGKELTLAMYEECCSIAKAAGHAIGEVPRSKAIEMLTKVGSLFTASMLRDLISGQKTEHDHILGKMIIKGEKSGVRCQLLKMAYTQIAVKQMKGS